jgi:hypothetical protein
MVHARERRRRIHGGGESQTRLKDSPFEMLQLLQNLERVGFFTRFTFNEGHLQVTISSKPKYY